MSKNVFVTHTLQWATRSGHHKYALYHICYNGRLCYILCRVELFAFYHCLTTCGVFTWILCDPNANTQCVLLCLKTVIILNCTTVTRILNIYQILAPSNKQDSADYYNKCQHTYCKFYDISFQVALTFYYFCTHLVYIFFQMILRVVPRVVMREKKKHLQQV